MGVGVVPWWHTEESVFLPSFKISVPTDQKHASSPPTALLWCLSVWLLLLPWCMHRSPTLHHESITHIVSTVPDVSLTGHWSVVTVCLAVCSEPNEEGVEEIDAEEGADKGQGAQGMHRRWLYKTLAYFGPLSLSGLNSRKKTLVGRDCKTMHKILVHRETSNVTFCQNNTK